TSTRWCPRHGRSGTSSTPTACRRGTARSRSRRAAHERRPRPPRSEEGTMNKAKESTTALATLGQGLAAGLIGTACMTALQEVSLRLKRRAMAGMKHEEEPKHDDPWKRAPAPAQLLKRAVEKATGVEPDPAAIPLYTNVTHWGYGITLRPAHPVVQR